jgi:hypothetical protein
MAKMTGMQPTGPSDAELAAMNFQARQLLLANGLNMWQQINVQSFNANIPGTVITIPLRNVGYVKKLYVEILCTVARSAAETQTRTPFGPANIFSNIILTDLSNNQRINTAGWHMHMLATARRGKAFGAAYTNDSPVDIGSNYDVMIAPTSFGAGNQTIRMFYEIPLAYSDTDLRGGIYASTVNATFQLQLTVNPNFFVAAGSNPVLAVYQSDGAALGTISEMTVRTYQNYLDQVPMGRNGPILPIQDLSQAYLINNTAVQALAVSQDNVIPYANFRDFLSTFFIFDQGGTLNAGTDVNYWALRSANYTNIFNLDPYIATLLGARNLISDDYPAGMYYFDFRQKPINTIQYGNMEMVLNPSSVAGATSQLLVGYEAMAIINQVTQAGSLYAQ